MSISDEAALKDIELLDHGMVNPTQSQYGHVGWSVFDKQCMLTSFYDCTLLGIDTFNRSHNGLVAMHAICIRFVWVAKSLLLLKTITLPPSVSQFYHKVTNMAY